MVVGPHLDYLMLPLPGFLLSDFFVGCGEVIAGQLHPAKVERVCNEFPSWLGRSLACEKPGNMPGGTQVLRS